MTSAPVVNGMDLMAASRTDNTQAHKTDEQFAGSLKKAVEKGEQGTENREKQEPVEKAGKQEDLRTAEERMKASGETKVVSNDSNHNAPVSEKNVSETVPEADVLNAVGEVTKALQESLDMTKEELEQAMELLGLSAVELLQPANIAAVLVEVTGVEDSLALVTEQPLYETWQSLRETAGEVLEELAQKMGVEPEEVEGLLQESGMKGMVSGIAEERITQDAVEQESMGLDEGPDMMTVQNTTHPATDESAVKTNMQDISPEETMQNDEMPEESATTVITTEETYAQKDGQSAGNAGDHSKGDERGNGQKKAEWNASPISENEFTHSAAQVETTFRPFRTEQMNHTDFLQEMSRVNETEEIARQILDHMKVQVKEGVSELEMQLHPASLGNVHVLLVAKEGNITAQFTAQTEAVKAALESQMVQLREQFEEQGIKVDAVEVAVSNHQFEKQYQGDEQREFQRNDRNKVRTRRINLEELEDEELDLLLTDEEKLQADIMKKNGSTVDFTA